MINPINHSSGNSAHEPAPVARLQPPPPSKTDKVLPTDKVTLTNPSSKSAGE